MRQKEEKSMIERERAVVHGEGSNRPANEPGWRRVMRERSISLESDRPDRRTECEVVDPVVRWELQRSE